jgi:hypothetical protein
MGHLRTKYVGGVENLYTLATSFIPLRVNRDVACGWLAYGTLDTAGFVNLYKV